MMGKTQLRLVTLAEAPHVHSLELLGFPADEAASLTSLQYRLEHAPDLFLGVYESDKAGAVDSCLGYTCGTRMTSDHLTHDSMGAHDPEGAYVGLHSLCVAPSQRRRGLALQLLAGFLQRCRRLRGVKGVRLIAHADLVPLYIAAGFTNLGTSSVVHGVLPWFEMAADWVERRNPGDSLDELTAEEQTTLVNAQGTNARDIYCIREECRCLLLKAGVGKWVINGTTASAHDFAAS